MAKYAHRSHNFWPFEAVLFAVHVLVLLKRSEEALPGRLAGPQLLSSHHLRPVWFPGHLDVSTQGRCSAGATQPLENLKEAFNSDWGNTFVNCLAMRLKQLVHPIDRFMMSKLGIGRGF